MDKDKEDILRELYQLKEENRFLNEDKETWIRDRELAGELGKTLLQQNKELETRLEEKNNEHHDIVMKMEELKQENHSLKSRIDAQSRAKDHHFYEIESLHKDFEQKTMMGQQEHDKKIKELKNEIVAWESEMEKHVMIAGQYKDKLDQQDKILENARQLIKNIQQAENLETDLEEQRQITAELQTEKDVLLMEITQLKNTQEQLAFDKKAWEDKFKSYEEEMQEKSRQSQMWYNCLQEARQEAGEFKAELEMLKAEVANNSFKNKGNSLFGEVEDKRVELEKKYLSMKTQHECLIKTHTVTKQHLLKLKNQVAALLQVRGNNADVSQMQRLQQACARKEGELKMLIEKVRALEKQQAENSYTDRLKEFHDAFSDFGDKKDYINFLEKMLQDEKKKTEKMQKEIETKTLLQLMESDRVSNTENLLHKAERNLDRFKAENMKLRLKIEELKIKQAKMTEMQQSDAPAGLSKSKSTSAIQKKVVLKRIDHKNNGAHVNANNTANESGTEKKVKEVVTQQKETNKTKKDSNSSTIETSDCIDLKNEIKHKEIHKEKDNSNKLLGENPIDNNIQNSSECITDHNKKVHFKENSKDTEYSEEMKENSEPSKMENEKDEKEEESQPKVKGVMSVTVNGQKASTKVIKVEKGKKNECAQQ